ncbi:MAG TPA: helix-turn-helix transcriptional regulator [Acidimicrobiales bacterium]|jgi:transcriptional regulator with XRE-family HTH domain|nr:helix-turn-helix transcriptional regulator [Acidimicrobiales bacterium]
MFDDSWKSQLASLGDFIRSQRQRANLTLREMADLANVSNPYLSQIERGLHEPSVRVLKAIASALDMSAETLLAHAGLLGDNFSPEPAGQPGPNTEAVIRGDPKLTDEQKEAMIAVYRGFVSATRS